MSSQIFHYMWIGLEEKKGLKEIKVTLSHYFELYNTGILQSGSFGIIGTHLLHLI